MRPSPAGGGVFELVLPLLSHLRLLIIVPLLVGAAALGGSYLIAPTFTAVTSFLPPQPQQSSAASALASLGALSGLAGAVGGVRSSGDQYVALMQSQAVADNLVDSFKLLDVYEAKYRFEARRQLASNVRIALGKKDGLITVEVDDKNAERAAALANAYVEELRRLTGALALTEAQQRRAFFESQLKQTRDNLDKAQKSLQSSGFNAGALRAEPKAAAERYARLNAEATAAEIRLQTLRRSLADATPEVQQQQTLLAALRSQVARLETAVEPGADADYLGKYRDFKYQETLFELFSRQYEAARIDESREGALIQVVDVAKLPEYKSRPKRAQLAIGATLAALIVLGAFLVLRQLWRRLDSDPDSAAQVARVRAALRHG